MGGDPSGCHFLVCIIDFSVAIVDNMCHTAVYTMIASTHTNYSSCYLKTKTTGVTLTLRFLGTAYLVLRTRSTKYS